MWIIQQGANIRLKVHVQPRASRTGITGLHGEALKIRLAAPPVDGAANVELIRFLAERLGIPKSRVELVSGASSRAKSVVIEGLNEEAVRQRLTLG